MQNRSALHRQQRRQTQPASIPRNNTGQQAESDHAMIQRAQAEPESLTTQNIIQLQRMLGNRTVLQLLRSDHQTISRAPDLIQRDDDDDDDIELYSNKGEDNQFELEGGFGEQNDEDYEGVYEDDEDDEEEEDDNPLKLQKVEFTIYKPSEDSAIKGELDPGTVKDAVEGNIKGKVEYTFEKDGVYTKDEGEAEFNLAGETITAKGNYGVVFGNVQKTKTTGEYSSKDGLNVSHKARSAASAGLQGGFNLDSSKANLKGKGSAMAHLYDVGYGASASSEGVKGGGKAFTGIDVAADAALTIKTMGDDVVTAKMGGGVSFGLGGELRGGITFKEGSWTINGKAKFAAGLGLNWNFNLTVNKVGLVKLANNWGMLGKAWSWITWGGGKVGGALSWLWNSLPDAGDYDDDDFPLII